MIVFGSEFSKLMMGLEIEREIDVWYISKKVDKFNVLFLESCQNISL